MATKRKSEHPFRAYRSQSPLTLDHVVLEVPVQRATNVSNVLGRGQVMQWAMTAREAQALSDELRGVVDEAMALGALTRKETQDIEDDKIERAVDEHTSKKGGA